MRIGTGKRTLAIFLLALLALPVAVPVMAGSVNKNIKIDAGSESDGGSSVNGSISVGRGASVSGDLSTVNGRVRVAPDATVQEVSTVNGSVDIGAGVSARHVETVNGAIRLAENVTIDGRLEAVNGDIKLGSGSRVHRSLGNINGDIEIDGSRVEGDITTVSGDIELNNAAEVMGNIRIEKPRGWNWDDWRRSPPRVVIGPGARVHGEIVAQHAIKLYISDSAEVGGASGEVTMADAVRFSGERP